jgi:Family of unknown function (DUF6159)
VNFMDKIKRSWRLAQTSYKVLRSDPEMLWYPVISMALCALGTLLFLPLFLASGVLDIVAGRDFSFVASVVGLIVSFLYYMMINAIVIFFNSALVHGTLARLDGKNPTFREGLNFASGRMSIILSYAAISATVGLLFSMLRDAARESSNPIVSFLGSAFAGLLGFAWNLATFFVVPVLVVENVGPIEAIKRSTKMLKSTWGEQIVGNAAIGFVFGLFSLLAFMIGLFLVIAVASLRNTVLLILAVGLLLIVVVGISLFGSTLSTIYRAALYRYVANGTENTYFSKDDMESAFLPKAA